MNRFSILIFVISFPETNEPFLLLYSAFSRSGVSQMASFRCWNFPVCVYLCGFVSPPSGQDMVSILQLVQNLMHGEEEEETSQSYRWGQYQLLDVEDTWFFNILITTELKFYMCFRIYNFCIYFSIYIYMHKYICYVF